MTKFKGFNPDDAPQGFVKSFHSGPSVTQLIKAGTAQGFTEIFCINHEGEKKIFYIPEHQLGLKRCRFGETLLILTKVTENPSGEAEFWLVTCAYSHKAWLFPLKAFSENGEYQPLTETTTAA